MPARYVPTSVRFWSKVDKSGECWAWTACKLPKGYGRFGLNGSVILAHRYSYIETHGTIPDGMYIDHLCFNTSCVRPTHLRAVHNKQNIENRAGLNANNTTGARGVYLRNGRYEARVKHNREDIRIGVFDTLEEAAEAARLKRLELFTHNDLDRVA